ncbi:hypothetical protein GA-1p06 [Bacillus phage GA1]|uniref:Uncharacterized protein n=1 Tax=Bacillus phage GA-1 TaxID=2679898 RepID=Q9FZX2_BPGA1|nr:hypothetical protein GA-1p06 [Bacillus phage GA1]CAC21521.1 hypothetical protein [Bacillus phage GA1]
MSELNEKEINIVERKEEMSRYRIKVKNTNLFVKYFTVDDSSITVRGLNLTSNKSFRYDKTELEGALIYLRGIGLDFIVEKEVQYSEIIVDLEFK